MKSMIANRYSLLHKVGAGGMADVYLAIDTILNREVAIKVLRDELAIDPVAVLRFKREANAALALNHPNIVEIFDVGEEDGQHYIVMEYIKGKTLKQLLDQRGALDKQEAVYIMKQLLSALVHAHKNNVVHRDIKPQNILIKDDGTIKLSDFGIALASNTAQAQLTQADAVLGSVHYLAPEIARGEQASEQSDIYALGVVLYELLSGDVPFTGEAPVQVAMKHMREDFPSIRAFNPTIPQALENVITKATAKNKFNRYKSTHAMSKDLESSLDKARELEEKLVFASEEDENNKTIVMSVGSQKTQEIKRHKISLSFERLLGLSVLLFAVIAIGIIVILTGNGTFKEPQSVAIPDVIGFELENAIAVMKDKGLKVSPVYRYQMSDTYEKGRVVSVVEGVEVLVKEGSTVQFVLSEGKWFVVDNYVGMSVEAAQRAITAGHNNIKVKIDYEVTKEYEPGYILRQEGRLPGDKLNPQTYYEIRFVVAKAWNEVVPEVIGMPFEDAVAMLESLGFKVKVTKLERTGLSVEELSAIVDGKVVSQDPPKDSMWTVDQPIEIAYY